MTTKTWLAGALAAIGLLSAASAASATSLDDIISAGKIKIAVPQDFAPFGSVGPDLKPEGYDVDVAKLIAKDLKVELELVPVTSANRIPYLQTKKVDLVISTLGANPERAKAIWFSAPYAPFFSGAFAKAGMAIAGPADLKGKTIGVTRGSLEDLEITKRAPEGTEIKRFEDNATTLAAYVAGQVGVLISGNVVAAKLGKENPDLKLETKFILKESPCFVGVRKGDSDLLQWVNVFIYHKKLGGELNDISMKWLGQPLPPMPPMY